jgi:hypothetical protein
MDSSDSFYVTLEQIKHAFNQLVHHRLHIYYHFQTISNHNSFNYCALGRFIISAPITTPTPAAQSSENSDFVKKKSGSGTTNATTTTANRAVKSAGYCNGYFSVFFYQVKVHIFYSYERACGRSGEGRTIR